MSLIARLRELEARATKGPWMNDLNTPYGTPCCSIHAADRIPGDAAIMSANRGNADNEVAHSWLAMAKARNRAEYSERTANATLIVSMRNALPLLLALAEAAEARVDAVRALAACDFGADGELRKAAVVAADKSIWKAVNALRSGK